ncbi:elongation factor TS-domain-containing protein [Endogone sp. FLAS-F59071]|nr:elongation factor TS-domain-containing protein [Endogone sp. FLAS-F59071]|eukprot:RUS16491.1 elongation factor TS-domain-containing protein [Endogone sp. FLAS-F59071]
MHRLLPIALLRPCPRLPQPNLILSRLLITTSGLRSTVAKPSVALLARLRQETQVPLTKAKEALVNTNNDYDAALAWLREDEQASGAKKAEKVKGRTASEGLVGVAGVEAMGRGAGMVTRGAIIELNCETDFVSRNPAFQTLATQVATTVLFLHDLAPATNSSRCIHTLPLDLVLSAPLLPLPTFDPDSLDPSTTTVQQSILALIGKLGENISLRRAAVVSPLLAPARTSRDRLLLTSHYVHGGTGTTGKIGSLVVLSISGAAAGPGETVGRLGRNLARQVVGYTPRYIHEADMPVGEAAEEAVLMRQGYMMGKGETVKETVEQVAQELGEGVKVEVVDFVRWEGGEGIERKEEDFVGEVMRAAGKARV